MADVVAGRALFVELRKDSGKEASAYQFLIWADRTHYRQITTTNPRRQWKQTVHGSGEPVGDWALRYIGADSVKRGYALTTEPFLVEATEPELVMTKDDGRPQRNITLRAERVMEKDRALPRPETPDPTRTDLSDDPVDTVRALLDKWQVAEKAGDSTTLTALTPPQGRSRKGVGAAGAPTAAAPEPTAAPAGPTIILRPNGQPYHVREIVEGIQDVALIRRSHAEDIAVLLLSAPGTGKTAMIEAAFTDLATDRDPKGLGFRYLGGTADTEVADFVGTYVQQPDGKYLWIDGPLVEAMTLGLPFMIDEIMLIDPRVMAVVYGAMDGRREVNVTANPAVGIVKAETGFYVIGASNPNAPGARMSEALSSRFLLQIEVTTDYDLAKRLGVSSRIVSAAQNLEHRRQEGELIWAPQMRELLGYKQIEKTFGTALAAANLVMQAPEMNREIVQGVIESKLGMAVKMGGK